MFYTETHGTFGRCYVETELTATSIRELAKLFQTETEATEFRNTFWPLTEVTAHVKHISQ